MTRRDCSVGWRLIHPLSPKIEPRTMAAIRTDLLPSPGLFLKLRALRLKLGEPDVERSASCVKYLSPKHALNGNVAFT